jgi:hypothetical protein
MTGKHAKPGRLFAERFGFGRDVMRARLRSLGVATVVGALLVVAGTAAPAAAATNPRVKPCISSDGMNFQETLGISWALVQPGCREIQSGATWGTAYGWYAAKTWEQVPVGYVPSGSTPIADFEAHLISARLVIDQGTRQEFTVEWRNGPALWVGEDGGYAVASVGTLGTIRPLSVGAHTVRRLMALSAMTCDGLSSDPDLSCSPAGEIDLGTLTFKVVH